MLAKAPEERPNMGQIISHLDSLDLRDPASAALDPAYEATLQGGPDLGRAATMASQPGAGPAPAAPPATGATAPPTGLAAAPPTGLAAVTHQAARLVARTRPAARIDALTLRISRVEPRWRWLGAATLVMLLGAGAWLWSRPAEEPPPPPPAAREEVADDAAPTVARPGRPARTGERKPPRRPRRDDAPDVPYWLRRVFR
jgi:hypothetical protein